MQNTMFHSSNSAKHFSPYSLQTIDNPEIAKMSLFRQRKEFAEKKYEFAEKKKLRSGHFLQGCIRYKVKYLAYQKRESTTNTFISSFLSVNETHFFSATIKHAYIL